MTLAARLENVVSVRAEERQPVVLFVVYYFLLGFAFALTQAVAFAQFVATYGPQRLPFAYMGVAVVVSLLALIYFRLAQRVAYTRLLALNLSFLIAASLAFWVGVNLPHNGAVVFLLPIWFEAIVTLGNLAFWSLAGRTFNVRQSKRLFGLIGAGNWIAATAGGFLTPPLIRLIGANQLLLVSGISVAAALALQVAILRRYYTSPPARPTPRTKAAPSPAQDSIRSLIRERTIGLIFALVIVWWLAFFFVDNIFFDRAAEQFSSAEDLASFIGSLVAVTGILALFTSFFLTGWVIRRFGLRAGLLVVPASLLVIMTALSVVGTVNPLLASVFWLAALAKLVNVALGFSLDQSARVMLYQPLPDQQRIATQTLADGVVQSLAIGLAGVSLLLFNTVLSFRAVELSYLFLVIAAAWVFIAVILAREYRASLVRALKKRALSGDAPTALAEPACIGLLEQQFHSPYPEAALYALDMLEQVAPEALPGALPVLLSHSSPDIRREALRRIEKLGRGDLLPVVQAQLDREGDAAVREAALRTFAALAGPDSVELMGGYLDDPSLPIRRGALIGLLNGGGIEGILIAGQRLMALCTSPARDDRRLAAEILGEIGIRSFYQPLIPLLSDPDPAVRRAALYAASQVNHPKLWPLVIGALTDQEVHRAAVLALIAAGASGLPAIEAAWQNPATPTYVLADLARACAVIRSSRVIDLLRPRLNCPDGLVRTQVLRALSAAGYHALPDDVSDLREQIEWEAAWAAWVIAARRDIGPEPAAALLASSFDHEITQIRERLFYLLSFLYDPQTILQARQALIHDRGARSAYALEVIEMMLPAELKGVILPLLDPSEALRDPHPLYPQNTLSVEERLRALLQERRAAEDCWMRACALYAVGLLRLTRCHDQVTAALEDPSALVRETARWALHHLSADPSSTSLSLGGAGAMLSTIEKVIILKTVGIFASIPDNVLAEIAGIVEEMEATAGETIFRQGDLGDSMYIIISGKVRVHQGERVLNDLGERDVFGEMALLDPEPRVASVTPLEETRLFRLGQEPFYQLVENYSDVARGLILVLTRRLRARVNDVSELHQRLQALEASAPRTNGGTLADRVETAQGTV